MQTFVDVVNSYRCKLHLIDMAQGLNSCIVDPKEHYSLAAISAWAHGKWRPGYSMLDHIHRNAPEGSWMSEFASKGMAALLNGDISPSPGQK